MSMEEAYWIAVEEAVPDYGNAAHAVDSGEGSWDADVEPAARLNAAIRACMKAAVKEAAGIASPILDEGVDAEVDAQIDALLARIDALGDRP